MRTKWPGSLAVYKMMVRLIFEKSGCEILATASGVNQCGSMFGCEP